MTTKFPLNIEIECHLKKMTVHQDSEVQYFLQPLDGSPLRLNPFINKPVEIIFDQITKCIHCLKQIPKTFGEGYCFNCFKTLARADLCIVRPELCHYDKGTCREETWGQDHCMIPHYVYLSFTSDYKIGITRHTHALTRWIDQGALMASPLVRVETRKESGMIESFITREYNDRTNWRQMLKTSLPPVDFHAEFTKIQAQICTHFPSVSRVPFAPVNLNYPCRYDSTTIKSVNPEKTPHIKAILLGFKGQYMEISTGFFNIRSHTGKMIKFIFSSHFS